MSDQLPCDNCLATGKHLLTLLRLTQLDVPGLGHALGLSPNVFYQLTREQADLPLDMPLAILVLYYLDRPDLLRRRRFDSRAIRQKLGLTQAAFGRLVGREAMAVSNWERGEVVPDRPVRTLVELLRDISPTEYARLRAISEQVWTKREAIRAAKQQARRNSESPYADRGETMSDHPDQLGAGKSTFSA